MTISGSGLAPRAPHILLVEDNHGDILLARKAFELSGAVQTITVATDGDKALAMLRNEAPYQDAGKPDLILLDLNLPTVSGHEVLEAIKADKNLQQIPVIVFSSSEAETDVVASYAGHANAYIVKPSDPDEFAAIAQKINQFWFNVVQLAQESA